MAKHLERLDGKFIVKIVEGDYCNEDAIETVIKYIGRDGENQNIGGTGIFPTDIDGAIYCFEKVQQIYGANCGRRIWHIIVSPESSWHFRDYDLIEIGNRICEYFSVNHQTFFGVHCDGRYYHIHFAINPVNYQNGSLLTFIDLNELKKYVKKIMQNYAEAYYFAKV